MRLGFLSRAYLRLDLELSLGLLSRAYLRLDLELRLGFLSRAYLRLDLELSLGFLFPVDLRLDLSLGFLFPAYLSLDLNLAFLSRAYLRLDIWRYMSLCLTCTSPMGRLHRMRNICAFSRILSYFLRIGQYWILGRLCKEGFKCVLLPI